MNGWGPTARDRVLVGVDALVIAALAAAGVADLYGPWWWQLVAVLLVGLFASDAGDRVRRRRAPEPPETPEGH
ncbi:hypothetical protein ACN20G_24595 [Streptomyces sp. BI20]|uniref:hypothetical protein n=1 Tax=Streptomyces sp. BI20 TaxID=3403460 RepID=UPI003C770B63